MISAVDAGAEPDQIAPRASPFFESTNSASEIHCARVHQAAFAAIPIHSPAWSSIQDGGNAPPKEWMLPMRCHARKAGPPKCLRSSSGVTPHRGSTFSHTASCPAHQDARFPPSDAKHSERQASAEGATNKVKASSACLSACERQRQVDAVQSHPVNLPLPPRPVPPTNMHSAQSTPRFCSVAAERAKKHLLTNALTDAHVHEHT